ncbi:MAG: ASCH domain-containing protein [Rikenellaceae bacterium]
MKRINFAKNWNGKLHCESFSSLRLENSEKYIVGDEEYAVWLGERVYSGAVLVSARVLPLSELTEEMAYLDTGLSLKETKELLREFYPDITEETKMHYLIFKVVRRRFYAKATMPRENDYAR